MIKRSFTGAQKKQVAARQGWRCGACDALLPASFQVDHVVPLWAGGEDSLDNASGLCGTCHAEKTQAEAVERAARKRARARDGRRPPMQCCGCGRVVSPYFRHDCAAASN